MSNTIPARKVGDFVEVTDARLRNAPWRSAGSWINESQDRDITAADVLVRAGLDWTVEQTPLTTTLLTASGVTTVEVTNRVSNTRVNRDGSAASLGIVSPSYTVVQNEETADLIDGITYEAGALYDAAGALKGGKRIYVAAKLPETVTVGGIDPVDTYLVISNGHDGRHGLSVEIKHLRLICTNGMSGWRNHSSMTLRHTRNMEGKVQQIRETMRLVYAESQGFSELAEGLLSTEITDQKFWSIVQAVFPVDDDASDRQKASVQHTRESVLGIYRGATQENIHGTAWGAWQAFVEYADWTRPVRANGAAAEYARAERNMLGKMERPKDRALALITS